MKFECEKAASYENKVGYPRHAIFKSIFEHADVGILITDADSRIVDANPACQELTGYALDEILGKNPRLFSAGITDNNAYQQMWVGLDETGFWQGEVCNRKKSGELYSERLTICTIQDQSKAVKNYVAVFNDVSYVKKHADELRRIAYYDKLTGLPNRLLLTEYMHQALKSADREEQFLAVCYLDLDDFKSINDQYGHKIGDRVLQMVADRLQNLLQPEDTVARPGGDEFVLLIRSVRGVDDFEPVMQSVQSGMAASYDIDGYNIQVSLSCGVVLYPLDDSPADTLLRHADQAMCRAKSEGKNGYLYFNKDEENRIADVQAFRQELVKALQDKEFVLHYQPKINMQTGEVVGVEALLRWQHPDTGLRGPDSFLPMIENDYLIVQIGSWVIEQALLQMRHWMSSGKEIKISVNVSALQLQQANFVSMLAGLLEKYSDVSASSLELEILETTVFQDIDATRRIMCECRKLGVKFSLDDFGTGYSSLTYLRQLPVETIKIDRSFIMEMLENPDDLAIVEGILGLATAFHRIPLAEGIESIQQGELLLKLGCVLGQGYAIAKPMQAEDMLDWIVNYELPDAWQRADKDEYLDLKFSMLNMAVEHHKTVSRALSAIEQRVPALLPKHLQDYHSCEFGQWLESECSRYCGDSPAFHSMTRKHMEIHDLIKQAANMLQSKDNHKLDDIVIAIKRTRSELLEHLYELQNKSPALQLAMQVSS